jgi:hypothetical protein
MRVQRKQLGQRRFEERPVFVLEGRPVAAALCSNTSGWANCLGTAETLSSNYPDSKRRLVEPNYETYCEMARKRGIA